MHFQRPLHCVVLISLVRFSFGFVTAHICYNSRVWAPLCSQRIHQLGSQTGESGGIDADDTRQRIQELLHNHPVILFMKGSKAFPQCGFSNTAIQILNACEVDFETFDVLEDEDIRQGIKDYSQWPTIPQLYVRGEFIGGADILMDLFKSDKLRSLMETSK